MEEKPKINDAAKTLFAVLVAKEKSSITETGFEAAAVLLGIQSLLKALKTIDLLDPIEWGRENPQLEAESGFERLQGITRYKAAFSLWRRAKSANKSPSQLLGKSFLLIIWDQYKSYVLKTVESEIGLLVLAALGQSLKHEDNDLAVVWEMDLGSALSQKQKVRKEQAQQRADEEQESLRNEIF